VKKTFFLVATAIFVLPAFAFGATTYVRTPTGSSITSPVSISFTADDFLTEVCPNYPDAQTWAIGILDNIGGDDRTGDFVPSSTLSNSYVVNLPVGYEALDVETICDLDNNLTIGSGFTIISASSQPMFTVPTTTATDLTANITSQLGDVGTLALIVIVASIPLAFYVIKKIISLIPKR
jgi:hypothetical protein